MDCMKFKAPVIVCVNIYASIFCTQICHIACILRTFRCSYSHGQYCTLLLQHLQKVPGNFGGLFFSRCKWFLLSPLTWKLLSYVKFLLDKPDKHGEQTHLLVA